MDSLFGKESFIYHLLDYIYPLYIYYLSPTLLHIGKPFPKFRFTVRFCNY